MSIELRNHLDTRVRKIGFKINGSVFEYNKVKKNILSINCINRNIYIDPNTGDIYGVFQFKNARFVSALYNIVNLNIWMIENDLIRELDNYVNLYDDQKIMGAYKGKEEKWVQKYEKRELNRIKNTERMYLSRKKKCDKDNSCFRQNKAIYVLERGLNSSKIYKIGSHTGSKEKLIKRYITSCPDLNILFFREINRAREIERDFKRKYLKYRIPNINGNNSEWFLMKLDDIVSIISKMIDEKELEKELENEECQNS